MRTQLRRFTWHTMVLHNAKELNDQYFGESVCGTKWKYSFNITTERHLMRENADIITTFHFNFIALENQQLDQFNSSLLDITISESIPIDFIIRVAPIRSTAVEV